jgi:hypothetical protein
MMMRRSIRARVLTVFVLSATAILLQACRTLQGVSLAPGQTLTSQTPVLNMRLNFIFSGTGTCDAVNIDWGDGQTETRRLQGVDLSGPVAARTVTHSFTGWTGGKTVTVEATGGCEGRVNTRCAGSRCIRGVVPD